MYTDLASVVHGSERVVVKANESVSMKNLVMYVTVKHVLMTFTASLTIPVILLFLPWACFPVVLF